jgi:hypothetical protein
MDKSKLCHDPVWEIFRDGAMPYNKKFTQNKTMTDQTFGLIGKRLLAFGRQRNPRTLKVQTLFTFDAVTLSPPSKVWSTVGKCLMDWSIFDKYIFCDVIDVHFTKAIGENDPSIWIQFDKTIENGAEISTQPGYSNNSICVSVDPNDYPGIEFQEAKQWDPII